MHIGEEEHVDDCQICVIVQAFSGDAPPKYELNFSCETCSYLIETAIHTPSIEIAYFKGFFSHAPPLLSFFK